MSYVHTTSSSFHGGSFSSSSTDRNIVPTTVRDARPIVNQGNAPFAHFASTTTSKSMARFAVRSHRFID
jgi:hypothetical protein